MATGLFTAISNLFSNRNFSKISDEQERALVDALTFAMAADHDVSKVEREHLTRALRVLDWRQATPLESYIDEAITRALRQIADERNMFDYCTDIAERLGEGWLREETYYLAGHIAAADKDINPDEQAYLRAMVLAFAIDPATQARIADQLLRETTF